MDDLPPGQYDIGDGFPGALRRAHPRTSPEDWDLTITGEVTWPTTFSAAQAGRPEDIKGWMVSEAAHAGEVRRPPGVRRGRRLDRERAHEDDGGASDGAVQISGSCVWTADE